MNYLVRLKNPVFLIPFVTAVISFIYQIFGVFGYVPRISQNDVMQIITLIVNVLVTLGILVDPTTKGIKDSDRALNYNEPN